MITVSPVVQTGLRVAITVTGLDSSAPAVSTVTLWRDDLDLPRSPVRGFVDYDPTSDGFVAYDHEAPLSRPVFYVLEVTRTDGTVVELAGGPVTLTATHPIVSNPVTGEAVVLAAIETWPELARTGRASVVDVVDRPDPVVVSVGMSAPSSSPVLRTDDRPSRLALRVLFATAQVLLIRDPHPDVEDAYVSVGKHAEQRVTNTPQDVRRFHSLEVDHVSPPALELAAPGDTLADLAAAFPGTLLDVSAAFPTLLDLAAADLEAL